MTQTFVEPVEHPVRIFVPTDVGWEPDDEESSVFSVIALDPGGTTGWSVFSIWPEAMADEELKILSNVAAWSAGEFTGTEAEQADQIMSLVEAWYADTHVVLEDFVLQKFTMSRDLLAPVRMTARIVDRMYVAGRSGQVRKPQSASMAMRTVTDDRLKAWGFWNMLPGKPHARDAVRHAITFLRLWKAATLAETKVA